MASDNLTSAIGAATAALARAGADRSDKVHGWHELPLHSLRELVRAATAFHTLQVKLEEAAGRHAGRPLEFFMAAVDSHNLWRAVDAHGITLEPKTSVVVLEGDDLHDPGPGTMEVMRWNAYDNAVGALLAGEKATAREAALAATARIEEEAAARKAEGEAARPYIDAIGTVVHPDVPDAKARGMNAIVTGIAIARGQEG